MRTKAVLFDFDGVIADTENIHVAAWERTFGELGWDVAPTVCVRAVEVDDRVFLSEVFANKGITDGNIEGWVRRKQALTVSMLSDWPHVYPGLHDLAHELSKRVRLAVVTGTWRENVAAVLKAAGLERSFETIVSKEDVRSPKPDPEPYRSALARMNLEPVDAIALEDSATGLASARSAGIRALAVGHRKPKGDWVGESLYVADLWEAGRTLDEIG
jgi:HAD superfamily hydrolase (TIGR01509 family)